MGQVFEGKKIFVVKRSHVGYSAYRCEYGEWLEWRVKELEDSITAYESMKEGVGVRIAGLEAEIERLKTVEKDAKTCREAMKWALRIMGKPNSLREPLKQYVRVGETCADGIERAHEKVLLLEAENERLKGELARTDESIK